MKFHLFLALLLPACSPREHPAPATSSAPGEEHALPAPTTAATFASTGYLAPLIDPSKLDTLKGDRAANGRMRKIAYWLETARRAGEDPAAVIDAAQRADGYLGTPRAAADAESLLRNLTILERLGCLDPAGMDILRRGRAPVITRGPYAGELATVDHIIPRAVVPELDEKLFNLEFMPASVNRKKGAGIGQRQRALAREWHASGLLSQAGLQSVDGAP